MLLKKLNYSTKFLLFACLFTTALIGCNMNNNDKDNENGMNDENGAETENITENDNGIIEDDNDNANIMNNNGNNRYDVADKAANKIAKLPEVEDATVLVTDENAYVAAKLNTDTKGEMTDKLEAKISKQVKATDPDIDNVFVSTNPDFFDRARDYSDRVQQGKPLKGLAEQFTETIRRVFPNQR